VYPAGFVYIYSLFYYLTLKGTWIDLAQWLFLGLQVLTVHLTGRLYQKAQVPAYILFVLSLSKRIHSIFLLRCFNDPVAFLFLLGSVHQLLKKNWFASSGLLSLGVSIKMNILLFLPGYAVILYHYLGLSKSLLLAIWFMGVQLGLALPFLAFPTSYLSRAFDFGRVFEYKWTVNWKFLNETAFQSSDFARILLLLHLTVLFYFAIHHWIPLLQGKKQSSLSQFIQQGLPLSSQNVNETPNKLIQNSKDMSAQAILWILFTSNFIGILFARSLHYQFYSWYFYTLPFLLWSLTIPVFIKLLLFFSIEYCWNVYPSTPFSSLLLFTCHMLCLLGLYFYKPKSIKQA
jgi:alpha-1,3-mannosyltransferase